MEEHSSRPPLLSPLLPRFRDDRHVEGDASSPTYWDLQHPEPPLIPCREVDCFSSTEEFVTAAALKAYSVLPALLLSKGGDHVLPAVPQLPDNFPPASSPPMSMDHVCGVQGGRSSVPGVVMGSGSNSGGVASSLCAAEPAVHSAARQEDVGQAEVLAGCDVREGVPYFFEATATAALPAEIGDLGGDECAARAAHAGPAVQLQGSPPRTRSHARRSQRTAGMQQVQSSPSQEAKKAEAHPQGEVLPNPEASPLPRQPTAAQECAAPGGELAGDKIAVPGSAARREEEAGAGVAVEQGTGDGELVGEEEEDAVASGAMTVSDAAAAAALRRIGKDSLQDLVRHQQQAAGGPQLKALKRKRGKGGGKEPDPLLAPLLNPSSRVYHPVFAAAFKEAKKKLEKRDVQKAKKEALRQHSKLVTRWSALTAEEHAWFQEHRGRQLVEGEAERMRLLAKKVAEEQQQYFAEVQSAGQAQLERYNHCTARQAAQIEADLHRRRGRVLRLPRVYRLHAVLPLPPADAADRTSQESGVPTLCHIRTLRQLGDLPTFTVPPPGTVLPGNALYLPCTLGPAELAQHARLAQQGGGGGHGPYRKASPPDLQHDPALPDLLRSLSGAQQAQHECEGQSPSGRAAETADGTLGGGGADTLTGRARGENEGGVEGGDGLIEVAFLKRDSGSSAPLLCCLPSSAFSCLAGTVLRGNLPAWEIPLSVSALPAHDLAQRGQRPQQGTDGAAGDAGGGALPPPNIVLYLEKPLVPRCLSMRQKQARLHKYAVLSSVLTTRRHSDADVAQPPHNGGASASPPPTNAQSPAAPRSTAPGPAAAVPQPAPHHPPAAATAVPRHTSYDLWRLGRLQLLVRSHDKARVGPEGAAGEAGTTPLGAAAEGGKQEGGVGRETAPGQVVVPVVKAEYLPPPDHEEMTLQDLSSWWCKLTLRPGSRLMACHANVPQAKLMHCRLLSAEEVTSRAALPTSAALRAVHDVMAALGALPLGRYLLTHAPYDATICLFKAVAEEALGEEAPTLPPLPCSASMAQRGQLYDLHAAHAHSGESDDKLESPYVPPAWRQFSPDVPQIPHTFPPRVGLGRLGVQRPRRRERGQVPHAWVVLGQGGDFDAVGHVGQISRQEYGQALEEELM